MHDWSQWHQEQQRYADRNGKAKAGRDCSEHGREEQWTEEGGRREGSGEPCSQRLTASAAPYSLACFYDDTLELTRFFEVQLHKVRTGL